MSDLEFYVTCGAIVLSLCLFGASILATVKPYVLFLWYLLIPPPLPYAYDGGYEEDADTSDATGDTWQPAPPARAAKPPAYAPLYIPQKSIVTPHAEWWPIVTQKAKHVRLIAPTDAGKSVTAMALASDAEGQILIIDPVWRPGNWGGLPAITVAPNGGYQPILAGLESLIAELEERGALLQQTPAGQDIPAPALTILWDEVPDTISAIKKLGADDRRNLTDAAGEVMRRVGMRGRHCRMRIIGMGQSDRVGAWGLEGFGDTAQNFATIYLMDKALEKRPDLLDKVERPAVLEWRGKVIAIDVSQLLLLSQRAIDPARVFRFGDTSHTAAPAQRPTLADDIAAWLDAQPSIASLSINDVCRGVGRDTGGDSWQSVRAALVALADDGHDGAGGLLAARTKVK